MKKLNETDKLMSELKLLIDFEDACCQNDTDYMNELLNDYRDSNPNNLELQNLGNDEIIELYKEKYHSDETDHTDLDKINRMYNYD